MQAAHIVSQSLPGEFVHHVQLPMAPAPQATSAATVVIFTLVLNTLTAPETRPMETSTGRCVHDHDLGSSWLAGHLPYLPPVGSDSGVVNITAGSSPLLLLLISLPGEGNRSVWRAWNYRDVVNRRIHHRPSLLLEPGIYGGAPRVQQEFVSSDPFGFNFSLDGALSSYYYASSMMFPNIQEPHTYNHPLRARAPVDFCYYFGLTGIGNQSSERGTFHRRLSASMGRQHVTLSRVNFAGGHRKLLGARGSSTKRNLLIRSRRRRRQQVVLLQEQQRQSSRGTAAAAALALIGLLCTIAGLVLWCRRRNRLERDEKLIDQIELWPSSPRPYSRRELAASTHGFAEAEKIGRGGFGPVYRGFLADQEHHVAIKVLLSSSVQAQGMREFQAEVRVMTRLRHRNIVQLLGWSGEAGGLMLVYELLPNGSLDKHLHNPQGPLLAWIDRYKIALGVGSAILYLHTECEQCVLHGDIKPANILLDASCNAKLGDFGLARLVDHGTGSRTTQVVAGTPGYIDPEFVNNGRPSAEADVFSFGVVLLELACGRRPTTAAQPNATVPVLLIDWVRDMYHKNTVLGAADRRLDGEFDDQQMRRVLVTGLWCTHQDQSQRPTVAQAMDLLRRQDAALPILTEMHSPSTAPVRSLEEIAYGDLDLSTEDSVFEDSSADTAYYTSEVSTCMLEC